jgi:hypothetical protein
MKGFEEVAFFISSDGLLNGHIDLDHPTAFFLSNQFRNPAF